MTTVNDNIRTFLAGDALPPQAADLLGDEVMDAFHLARQQTHPTSSAAPGADTDAHTATRGADRPTQPMVIAATNDGEWRGGIYLLIEQVGQGPGADRVASIRQLIIRPQFRGRGLAGWLLRRAHTVATEMGCRRIRSTAGWGCPDHLSMYTRLGYQRGDEADHPYLVSLVL